MTIFIRFKLILNLPLHFPSVWTVLSYRAAASPRVHVLPLQSAPREGKGTLQGRGSHLLAQAGQHRVAASLL